MYIYVLFSVYFVGNLLILIKFVSLRVLINWVFFCIRVNGVELLEMMDFYLGIFYLFIDF